MVNASILASVPFQDDSGGLLGLLSSTLGLSCSLILAVIFIVAWWRVFEKAGQPGWAAIIPFFNLYILLKIAGRPGWWLILFLIPFVNIVVAIIMSMDVAKAFGKSAAYGIILLFLLNGIGYLILGFGDAQYQGVPAS